MEGIYCGDRFVDVTDDHDDVPSLAAGCDPVTVTEYVPAFALDAANEALRVANEENKRLRALLASVRCGRCGGSGRYFPPCDFCADSTHDHECPPSSDCASCAGTGDRFHAALAPKESSDA